MNKTLRNLAASAALAVASVPALGARTKILVGDDTTRFSWVDKPVVLPFTDKAKLRKEIAAWNKAVDAKKAAKRKQARLNKIRDRLAQRGMNDYRYDRHS